MRNPSNLRHSCLAIGLLVAAGLQAWGQEVETVVIANQPIARIRDKGSYASVSARAAAIDKAICEVISSQDTQHPKVAAKQSQGAWYVYSGSVRIMGVYAGDAKASGGTVRDLAVQWADNVRKNLPLATPCSKLPASAFKLKPGQVPHPQFARIPDAAPGIPATPGASVIQPIAAPAAIGAPIAGGTPVAANATGTDGPATGGAAPSADPGPATPAAPAANSLPRNASLLLILDAFNIARNLSQEDYIAKRDEVASNLLANLASFMGDGSGAAAKPTPTAVHVPTGTAGPTGTTGPTGVTSTPKPFVANPKPRLPKPAVVANPKPTPKPLATEAMVAASGAAGSKAAQKARIRAKINSCQAPLDALQTTDPATAGQVTDLLKACRQAFAAKSYDAAEEFVDHAIQLMSPAGAAAGTGAPPPQ